ncbi:MAG: zinc ABC transporter substrate-binding protein [Gammaproteobacteria bacterium]|nr:zinc ABC transporter substrate-binding protein [Gammaproteobacteria bacterium]
MAVTNAPSTAEGAQHEKPTVAVANYPLKYFAERIGGDRIKVVFPIPLDVDPAFWVPEPEGVLTFQAADLILLNGATYSKWLNKVSLPRRKLVNTSQSFKDQYIEIKGSATHTHGPEGAHAHAGLAFTTWIDFQQAIQQAEAIRDVLARLIPEQKNDFEANFSALKDDLLTLDRRAKEIVTNERAQPLITSHPVYDYFARRYGLNIKTVLWEPDEMPSNEQWVELISILRNHPARWMIWEGEPSPDSVDKLKSMEVESLVFDPCVNVPDQGDFLTVMKQNVKNLRSAFR